MYEDELSAVVGVGAVTGNIGAFVTELGDLVDRVGHQAHIDAATAGSVTADLETLSSFYNSLSELHQQLLEKRATLKGQALDLHDAEASGQVAGVQKAWKAIGESAGVMQHAESLYGNLQTIDHWVQHFMGAVLHNLQEYAKNEQVAIQTFTKASDANVPVPTRSAGGKTTTGSSRSGW
ncbi:MAG: hypothetical protein JF597_49525 [Streptomyces sp.]|uniref:hypothetical protein n=1 Tax=Streptomyces sp. TaxID=1931 RepID=UPI0025F00F0A|nr:hypothetical protein [Streptomyces sp.]MBW8801311.1 hypothetical protein [Streptomyces sp.]